MEKIKKLILIVREIETIIDLKKDKKLNNNLISDIYQLTNDLILNIKNIQVYDDSNRDVYKELRAIGLTHDNCDSVLELIDSLFNKSTNEELSIDRSDLLPSHYIKVGEPSYNGKGSHSVEVLENIIESYTEYTHQLKIREASILAKFNIKIS